MKINRLIFFLVVFICSLLLPLNKVSTQTQVSSTEFKIPATGKGLFDSEDVLQITLKGNLKELMNDRTGVPKDFSFILSNINEDKSVTEIPVVVKTRGHFRRSMGPCTYPPLSIQFAKDGAQGSTIFKEQKKLKLVMPCTGDGYVIKEWLVYKLYNLITPLSFKSRLVSVTLIDSKTNKASAPFYGLLLEEEKQMAKRNNTIAIEKKLRPRQTQLNPFLKMAVFQYMIGNTDWSVEYLQNIKLLTTDTLSAPVAVPYDFDHAGIVYAPYAKPDELLLLISVRERRYRGYCVEDLKVFEDIIAEYNRLKNDIYSVYTGCTLLEQKYIKSTIQYLDEFYKTINNPKAWKKEFAYPCDKSGTGNVILKGLKEE